MRGDEEGKVKETRRGEAINNITKKKDLEEEEEEGKMEEEEERRKTYVR